MQKGPCGVTDGRRPRHGKERGPQPPDEMDDQDGIDQYIEQKLL